jgi:hypothetical protein
MNNRTNENTFSIELRSKEHLGLDQSKEVVGPVLLEGTLGKILTLEFVEGAMLELKGTDGVLRMDITESEWNKLLRKEAD